MPRSIKIISATIIGLLAIAFVIASFAIPNFPIPPAERRGINRMVNGRGFNFVVWELNALSSKISSGLVSGPSYLLPARQRQLFLDYLKLIGDARRLERELDTIYAESAEPAVESQALQQQLRDKRAEIARLQPVAESVVQSQVDDALSQQGFGQLGGAWPPVAGQMSPLPLMLIVSPRDDIRQEYAFALEAGMSVADRDVLEQQIREQFDLAALVVPIGGLGIFPSMIVETNNIVFLSDTYAHEWAHHWLTLNPIGINYAKSSQMRTINETTASIVGEEIGRLVLEQHYPALLPPPPAPPAIADAAPAPPADPNAFDFGAEMNVTRVRVDELIAAGQLDEADRYMEERRQYFVENGRRIRKLNQAYFAFYGGYATEPGAQGEDPVGPMVVAVRENSDSLRDFLQNVRGVTSFGELELVLNELTVGETLR